MCWKWGSDMKPKHSPLRLEQLETRDAPATLVSATKLTYQDVDGDNVAVTLSKPLLTAVNVNSVFAFDTGSVDQSNSTKQQLRTINLTGFGVAAAGTSINAVAAHSPVTGGDGQVNVGFINSTGIDLGAVNIGGDLGRILAGDNDAAVPALKSLTVRSMGRFGTDTQAPGGKLESDLAGALGTLAVKTDVIGAFVNANGPIGSVIISGSLKGGSAVNSGSVVSAGDMGRVKIGQNIQGGSGARSGQI